MASERVERRLTAILAADVAGYSRLMGADEEATHAQLKVHRREVVDSRIAEHHGRIVKTTGDGLLAEFASVVDAVRCAVELQDEMAKRNADVPPDRRIEFRVGINVGDIILDESDIFGDGVNVAARLEALAEPGGICVSRMARDEVRDKLALSFEDLGDQQVKNIARPVRAYRVVTDASVRFLARAAPGRGRRVSRRVIAAGTVALVLLAIGAAAGIGFWRLHAPHPTPTTAGAPAVPPVLPDKPSIAVLPFANLSGDPAQDYLADGLTDNLIDALAQDPGLFVIARNATLDYRGKAVAPQAAAKDLGVRYVLEGSVQKSGDRVRVTAQLIDAASGSACPTRSPAARNGPRQSLRRSALSHRSGRCRPRNAPGPAISGNSFRIASRHCRVNTASPKNDRPRGLAGWLQGHRGVSRQRLTGQQPDHTLPAGFREEQPSWPRSSSGLPHRTPRC